MVTGEREGWLSRELRRLSHLEWNICLMWRGEEWECILTRPASGPDLGLGAGTTASKALRDATREAGL